MLLKMVSLNDVILLSVPWQLPDECNEHVTTKLQLQLASGIIDRDEIRPIAKEFLIDRKTNGTKKICSNAPFLSETIIEKLSQSIAFDMLYKRRLHQRLNNHDIITAFSEACEDYARLRSSHPGQLFCDYEVFQLMSLYDFEQFFINYKTNRCCTIRNVNEEFIALTLEKLCETNGNWKKISSILLFDRWTFKLINAFSLPHNVTGFFLPEQTGDVALIRLGNSSKSERRVIYWNLRTDKAHYPCEIQNPTKNLAIIQSTDGQTIACLTYVDSKDDSIVRMSSFPISDFEQNISAIGPIENFSNSDRLIATLELEKWHIRSKRDLSLIQTLELSKERHFAGFIDFNCSEPDRPLVGVFAAIANHKQKTIEIRSFEKNDTIVVHSFRVTEPMQFWSTNFLSDKKRDIVCLKWGCLFASDENGKVASWHLPSDIHQMWNKGPLQKTNQPTHVITKWSGVHVGNNGLLNLDVHEWGVDVVYPSLVPHSPSK